MNDDRLNEDRSYDDRPYDDGPYGDEPRGDGPRADGPDDARLAALEALLKSADRPTDVGRGMRCRILQAASRAHSRQTRWKQHATTAAICVAVLAGVTLFVGQLARLAPLMPLFAHWHSTPADVTTTWPSDPLPPAAMGLTSQKMGVPAEWRLVDTLSESRETHSRAFGSGLWE